MVSGTHRALVEGCAAPAVQQTSSHISYFVRTLYYPTVDKPGFSQQIL
jgi:hypothetical protein